MNQLPQPNNSLPDPKDPFGKALRKHLFGGFAHDHSLFDTKRYAASKCQLCERPSAVRCSSCSEVLDAAAAACPNCGEFYSGEEPPDEETHRMLLAFCCFHALNEFEDN